MNKVQKVIITHLTENHAVSTSEKLKNIFMLLFLNVAWVLIVVQFLKWLWPMEFIDTETGESYSFILQFWGPPPPFRYEFFMACIAAPLWEELAFRYAPYQIAKNLNEKLGNTKHELLLPVISLSTILFGWGHGNGTISLLIQGFGGLFLTYAYIKNNYSYWSSVLLHFLWNFGCILLQA